MLYEKLAVKRYEGIPLFNFWAKKCLCNGRDWEQWFLQGLTTSKVIILLMSNKVCLSYHLFSFNLYFIFQATEIIVSKASKQQDNVLLEYLDIMWMCQNGIGHHCNTRHTFTLFLKDYSSILVQTLIINIIYFC